MQVRKYHQILFVCHWFLELELCQDLTDLTVLNYQEKFVEDWEEQN